MKYAAKKGLYGVNVEDVSLDDAHAVCGNVRFPILRAIANNSRNFDSSDDRHNVTVPSTTTSTPQAPTSTEPGMHTTQLWNEA